MDNLTYEIIKRIITDVGAVPDESLMMRGLASEPLLLAKTLSVKYEDGARVEHDIYSGKLLLDKEELRGLLINLSVEDSSEFLFAFRFGTMPIHIIRVVYHAPEDSFIRIYNEEHDKWIVPNVATQAGLLASFEKFVSWGILWNECKETSDLYDIAVKLVQE